jgi:hypothetical protein
VEIDNFTTWVEAIPLRTVTSKNMVDFVKEHIVYRFGIPQSITIDQGTIFTSEEFRDFATNMGIMLYNSSPYDELTLINEINKLVTWQKML